MRNVLRNILRTLWMSILEGGLIIIVLISIVQMHLPMPGTYLVFAATAVVIPVVVLLLYKKIWGGETLVIVPISLVLSALYSLGVSLYSYYGTSHFSDMFNELMYYIYFLPSVIYCGMGWIGFAVVMRLTREPRRT